MRLPLILNVILFGLFFSPVLFGSSFVDDLLLVVMCVLSVGVLWKRINKLEVGLLEICLYLIATYCSLTLAFSGEKEMLFGYNDWAFYLSLLVIVQSGMKVALLDKQGGFFLDNKIFQVIIWIVCLVAGLVVMFSGNHEDVVALFSPIGNVSEIAMLLALSGLIIFYRCKKVIIPFLFLAISFAIEFRSLMVVLVVCILIVLVVLDRVRGAAWGGVLVKKVCIWFSLASLGLSFAFVGDAYQIFGPRIEIALSSLSVDRADCLIGNGWLGYGPSYTKLVLNGNISPIDSEINTLAFNDFVDVYFSGGLIGLVLLIFCCLALLRKYGIASLALFILMFSMYPLQYDKSIILLGLILRFGASGSKFSLSKKSPIVKWGLRIIVVYFGVVCVTGSIGRAIWTVAALEIEKGELVRGGELFEGVSFFYNEDYDFQLQYAHALEVQGFEGRSIEVLESIIVKNKGYDVISLLADKLFEQGHFHRASLLYQEASELRPKYLYSRYRLFFCYVNERSFSKAIEICEEVNMEGDQFYGFYRKAFFEDMDKISLGVSDY